MITSYFSYSQDIVAYSQEQSLSLVSCTRFFLDPLQRYCTVATSRASPQVSVLAQLQPGQGTAICMRLSLNAGQCRTSFNTAVA